MNVIVVLFALVVIAVLGDLVPLPKPFMRQTNDDNPGEDNSGTPTSS